jgi:predicted peroxiredoxin
MTTAHAPVPSFDDDAGGRKLAIICSKGSLDMAYPGLILANAALGEGIETHLFFTFWGFEIINKSDPRRLQPAIRPPGAGGRSGDRRPPPLQRGGAPARG